MATIRPYRSSDLDALYAISLATGDRGEDASALYEDPLLIGHVYAGPYAALAPDLAFVMEDRDGVAGYVVGATDTRVWEDRLEREWWPDLRLRYADPAAAEAGRWTADQMRAAMIHHPPRVPPTVCGGYPAHLHMNMLPRLHGQGFGVALLDVWMPAAKQHGAGAVHIGANRNNLRGIRFWEKSGFREIDLNGDRTAHTIWMGRSL